ncbi:unnamed protein product [Mytilus coruscus]|uniref:Uncharacterized protein n=1 Tax=Mytilus coruscus TaxID=42192 RepID=A0A6J8AIF7_MYTCO|nr:unnamed protein product [Mytilus coruscus]
MAGFGLQLKNTYNHLHTEKRDIGKDDIFISIKERDFAKARDLLQSKSDCNLTTKEESSVLMMICKCYRAKREGESVSLVSYLLNRVSLMSSSDVLHVLFNRSDWHCPVGCDSYIKEPVIAGCCMCRVEVKEKTMTTLNVVYDEVSEEAVIHEPNILHVCYQIQHKFEGANKLPINLCNFTGIVEIDFSFNEIANIDTISGVKGLETLAMSWNKIEYLKK